MKAVQYRPRRPRGIKDMKVYSFYLSTTLMTEISAAAKAQGKTTSEYVECILQQTINTGGSTDGKIR